MAIQLPTDVEARIQQRVASGDFADAGEVVREAMRLLDERDRQTEELRLKLQSGLDQLGRGESVTFSPDLMAQIRQDARDRLRRGERPKADVVP